MGGLAVAGLMMLAGGCDLGSGPPPEAASIVPFAGTEQTATVATPVPVSPAVRVLGRNGKPLKGREVVFSVVSGGGQLSGSAATTDKEGIAAVGSWLLGTTAGPQALQARVADLPPLVFFVTGAAGDPSTLTPVGGNGQTGVVGSALEIPPSVRVRDSYGNAVEGASVDFLVTSGGGFVVSTQAEADPTGVASSGAWTLGTNPGPNTLSASLSDLPSVSFQATAHADVPSRVTLLEGGGQTGTVTSALPLRPTVQIADRFGNPLVGIPVMFEVSGGGSIQGGSSSTGPGGVALSGPWTLGTRAGPQTLRITVSGLEPLIVTATAKPGPVASALALGGAARSATVGREVEDPPRVRVEDAYGNPVPGLSVVFSVAGAPDFDASPGAVQGQETITDAAGTAKAGGWLLGTIAGSYFVTAEVDGLADPVAFSATAISDDPVLLELLEGGNQAAPVGTAVPTPPTFWVGDQFRNGVAGVPVSFDVIGGGGVLSEVLVPTDADGAAVLGSWTLGPVAGVNRMSASVEGIEPVTLEAVGLTAPPATITRVAGNGQATQVGTAVPTPPKVRVTDAAGIPVASVPVSFSAGGGEDPSPVGRWSLTRRDSPTPEAGRWGPWPVRTL